MTNKYLEKIAANRHEQHVMSKMDVSDPNRVKVTTALRATRDLPGAGDTRTQAKKLEELKLAKHLGPRMDPNRPAKVGPYQGSRFDLGKDAVAYQRSKLRSPNVLSSLREPEAAGKATAAAKEAARVAVESRVRFPSGGGVTPSMVGGMPHVTQFVPPIHPVATSTGPSIAESAKEALDRVRSAPTSMPKKAPPVTPKSMPAVAKGLSRAGKAGLAAGALAGIAGIGAYMHNQKA